MRVITPLEQNRSPRGRRAWGLSGFLVGVAVTLCLSGPPRAEAAPPTTVAVGDSITNGARPSILDRFAREGWSGGVTAVSGIGVGGLRPYIQYIAGFTPALQRMFLFAGTNNALAVSMGNDTIEGAKFRYNRAVHDVIDVRPKACVFLVTVNRELNDFVPSNPYSRAAFLQAVDTLNAQMFSFARKYPKVHVIDWDRYTNDHDGGPGEDDFMIDNIHPDFVEPGHRQGPGHRALADRYRNWGGVVSGCGTTLP